MEKDTKNRYELYIEQTKSLAYTCIAIRSQLGLALDNVSAKSIQLIIFNEV